MTPGLYCKIYGSQYLIDHLLCSSARSGFQCPENEAYPAMKKTNRNLQHGLCGWFSQEQFLTYISQHVKRVSL